MAITSMKLGIIGGTEISATDPTIKAEMDKNLMIPEPIKFAINFYNLKPAQGSSIEIKLKLKLDKDNFGTIVNEPNKIYDKISDNEIIITIKSINEGSIKQLSKIKFISVMECNMTITLFQPKVPCNKAIIEFK